MPPRVATPRPDAAQPAAPVEASRDLATASVAPFAEPAACRWELAAWSGAVSLTPGGPPFAAALGSRARIAAPTTADPGLFAELSDSGVRLAVWIAQPSLYLTEATALAQVVYPKPTTPLAWRGVGRVGALEVSLAVDATLATPTTARAELPCDRLALAPGAFAPTAPPTRPAQRITRAATPIAAAAGREPAAELRADLAIAAGRRRGGATWVVVDGGDHVVAGWVPSRMLTPGAAPHPYAIDFAGAPRTATTTIPSPHNAPCARDVPLFIERQDTRASIGALVAGSPYPERLTPPDARGFVAVQPYGAQWLVLEPGVRLVARVADLDGCRAP